jgi:N-acetylglucosaminylphosphatidylinositol deacetylase
MFFSAATRHMSFTQILIPPSDFPDSMTTEWSATKISSLLSDAFAPALQNPASPKNSSQPTATIDVLITFDGSGISSHPNHISLFHGARHFISSLIEARPGWDCPVGLYTLTTVGIARKYASFADVLVSSITEMMGAKEMGSRPSPLLFVSDWKNLRRAQKAMTDAHISQMRWFRWGWIGLSRYMVMNDLRLERFSRKPVDEDDVKEEKEKETAAE